MNSNPNNLGRVKYLRLLSHQRHIANYLGCLFGEETVVRYTVLHGFRELIPHLIYRTISSYLHLGDTYSVAYNDRQRELFVCGFWV